MQLLRGPGMHFLCSALLHTCHVFVQPIKTFFTMRILKPCRNISMGRVARSNRLAAISARTAPEQPWGSRLRARRILDPIDSYAGDGWFHDVTQSIASAFAPVGEFFSWDNFKRGVKSAGPTIAAIGEEVGKFMATSFIPGPAGVLGLVSGLAVSQAVDPWLNTLIDYVKQQTDDALTRYTAATMTAKLSPERLQAAAEGGNEAIQLLLASRGDERWRREIARTRALQKAGIDLSEQDAELDAVAEYEEEPQPPEIPEEAKGTEEDGENAATVVDEAEQERVLDEEEDDFEPQMERDWASIVARVEGMPPSLPATPANIQRRMFRPSFAARTLGLQLRPNQRVDGRPELIA